MWFVLAILAIAIGAFYFAPKGWRTWASNVAAGSPILILQILELFQGFDFSEVMTPRDAALAMLAVNVLNLVWRHFTTTPLGAPR